MSYHRLIYKTQLKNIKDNFVRQLHVINNKCHVNISKDLSHSNINVSLFFVENNIR